MTNNDANGRRNDDTNVLIPLSGLWRNEGRDGKTYLRGNLTPHTTLYIFANSFKKQGSNDPDYQLYIAKSCPKPESRPEPVRREADGLDRHVGGCRGDDPDADIDALFYL